MRNARRLFSTDRRNATEPRGQMADSRPPISRRRTISHLHRRVQDRSLPSLTRTTAPTRVRILLLTDPTLACPQRISTNSISTVNNTTTPKAAKKAPTTGVRSSPLIRRWSRRAARIARSISCRGKLATASSAPRGRRSGGRGAGRSRREQQLVIRLSDILLQRVLLQYSGRRISTHAAGDAGYLVAQPMEFAEKRIRIGRWHASRAGWREARLE